MTRTDEQELVLGNKQLLSAFFVVVVLLAVFFTAGYLVGRNTGSRSTAADASADASPAPETAHTARSRNPEPAATAPTKPAAPSVEESRTEETAASVAPKSAAKQPEPEVESKNTPAKAQEPVGAVTAQVTPGHQYLQLMAVKRPVADSMVKLLKGRGYPALLGESSKPELFRVLVGPFTDMASLAKTKSGLKAAGFESVIAK